MVRSKVTHGASNRWLIFLVPYFWRHLLEGRNPEVTRGWVAFESQSRWESQWAPTPPQCPTEDRRGLLFPIWEEGCSPPTPSSSTPKLAGMGKRPLSDITKCLGSVWKTEGSGL